MRHLQKKKLSIIFSLITSIICAQNLHQQRLQQISQKLQEEYNAIQQQAKEHNATYNWHLSNDEILSIHGFVANGIPVFPITNNQQSAKAIDADLVSNITIDGTTYSLTGDGVTVHIWDGPSGILDTHQELNGRITVIDNPGNLSNSHPTHVTGTLMASGVNPAAKGMAPMATGVFYDFNGIPFNEITNASASLSNHSWGYESGWLYANSLWYFYSSYNYSLEANTASNYGYYDPFAETIDDILYNQPNHIMIKSVGNSNGGGPSGNASLARVWDGTNWVTPTNGVPPNNCANGYDCVSNFSNSKNLIAVGAIEKFPITSSNPEGRYQNASDCILYSGSSIGPRDDGGIKPDVVAVGTNIFSSISTGIDQYQGGWQGTSMSCPATTGVMALFQEMYQDVNGAFMRADMGKTVLIHTTNEAGPNPGPDYQFGWGLVNAVKGATLVAMDGNTTYLEETTLNNNQTFEFTFTADGNEPIKATISWTDPAATPLSISSNYSNIRTSRLVNDLDLRIVKISDNSTNMPWKLDPDNPSAAAIKGDNIVDNVEQVVVDSPTADAQYKVVVTHKGTLVNDLGTPTPSNFALAISGIKAGSMSTDDINSELSTLFSIYPNPVENQLHIQNAENVKIERVSIFNTAGTLVQYNNKVQGNSLDVSQLESGIYLIQIDTEKGKWIEKFVKK